MYIRPTINSPTIHRSQVKLYIKDAILQQLYGKSEQVFRDILHDIHKEQKELTKAIHMAFSFRGKQYNRNYLTAPDTLYEFPPLHLSLHERMQKYIDDRAQVFDFEKPCVEGVLKAMFTHTEFLGDYHDLLPESLHRCFDGYIEMFASMDNKRFNTEQAIEFKQRNERYLQLIRNRMMMNILL